MTKTNPIWTILKMFGVVIGAAMIGLLLLWGAYLLPTEPMAKNVVASEQILREQDDAKYFKSGEFWKALDLGTNIIMLYETIVPNSKNALQDALTVPSANVWEGNWTDTLINYAENRDYAPDSSVSYARYWHGYLIFLKPLFLFLDLNGIYILNTVFQFGLMVLVFVLMRKKVGIYCYAYLFTILTMNPIYIMQSFQLSTVFYVLHITLLLLLIKKWKKDQVLYLFVLDGIFVSFLDFLTYPLVAFAIPLLTYWIIVQETEVKDVLVSTVKHGLAFTIGYAGMWGMKWIFATVFTNQNVVVDAILSVVERTGINEEANAMNFMGVSAEYALSRNFNSYFNPINCLIIIISLIVILGICFIKYRKIFVDVNQIVKCLIIGVMPFVWLIALKNHCSLHPHLEWRTCSVLFYAIVVFLIGIFTHNPRNKEEVNG